MPFKRLLHRQNANKFKDCYYMSSDLKNWLNVEFLEKYFKTEERIWIKSVNIPLISDIIRRFPYEENQICISSYITKENGAAIVHSYNDSESCVY